MDPERLKALKEKLKKDKEKALDINLAKKQKFKEEKLNEKKLKRQKKDLEAEIITPMVNQTKLSRMSKEQSDSLLNLPLDKKKYFADVRSEIEKSKIKNIKAFTNVANKSEERKLNTENCRKMTLRCTNNDTSFEIKPKMTKPKNNETEEGRKTSFEIKQKMTKPKKNETELGVKTKNKGTRTNTDQIIQKKRENVRIRVQKHRAKMSEEKLMEKRRKDRERYNNKKRLGLTKCIKDLVPKKQKQKRKNWKEASLRYRNKKKLQHKTEAFINENSPPSTDDEQRNEYMDLEVAVVNVSAPAETNDSDQNENKLITKHKSIRKLQGRKIVKRNRASCYRQLQAAKREILELKKEVNKYKKRITRDRQKKKKSDSKVLQSDTPETKINKLTAEIQVPPEVKRQLLFGEVLTHQVAQNFKMINSQKTKNIVSKVISGKVMKKYKMIGKAKSLISYKMHKKQKDKINLLQFERKKRNSVMSQRIHKSVQDFFVRDEYSKMCPGKKDFIVKGKHKRQKRILLGSIKQLHSKYLETDGCLKISKATFWRYKPFWVVSPKQSDRETCVCIKHANIHLMVEKLYYEKLAKSKYPDELLKDLVCDDKNMACMLRNCITCKNRKLKFKTENVRDLDKILIFRQWESKAEDKIIKGEKKSIRITTKSEKKLTVRQLLELLNKKLVEYMKHVHFMRHQQRELQKQRSNIEVNEILIQIDFSENYVAKFETEIQSMHFGASKKQISLHTGVYYYRPNKDSPVKTQSFCSVSDNLDHQSHGIWAHLHRILLELSETFPDLYRIHFYSDGPTSQYKNRNNFYFFINKISQYFPNIEESSWNFSESGHGKGPMDGVGGSLKRKADQLVLKGNDITCANDFVEHLVSDSLVKIYEVGSEEIKNTKNELPKKIPGIPNIMTVHQITWSKQNDTTLFLRSLSCFSCPYNQCVHYSLKPSNVCLMAKQNKTTHKFKDNGDRDGDLPVLKGPIYLLPDTQDLESAQKFCPSKNTAICPKKREINIISNQVILPFPQNDQIRRGLCFSCTFTITEKVYGIKCKHCSRSYHTKCILKLFQLNVNEVFICKVCSAKNIV